MRSLIFYIMASSLCLATSLAAKPMPLREVPQREAPQREAARAAEQAAAALAHRKHPKHPKRVKPNAPECKACAAAKSPAIHVAIAPQVIVNHQPPVQRVAAVQPNRAIVKGNFWHSPQLVAPTPVAPAPVFAIQQPVVVAPAPVAAPAIVYEQAPAAVVVEYQPAVRPYVALTPFMISSNLKYLTLSDRTEWRIRHRDRPRVRHWHSGDLISIELGSYFSRFQYKLINHTRREAVEANRL